MATDTPAPPTCRAGAVCALHNGAKHDRGNAKARQTRRAAMLKLHGCECVYCGTFVDGAAAEQDRVVESCYYHLANLVPACKACNNARNRNEVPTLDGAATERLRAAYVRLLAVPAGRLKDAHIIREGVQRELDAL